MNLKKVKKTGLKQKIYGTSVNLRNAQQRKDSTKISELAHKLAIYKKQSLSKE